MSLHAKFKQHNHHKRRKRKEKLMNSKHQWYPHKKSKTSKSLRRPAFNWASSYLIKFKGRKLLMHSIFLTNSLARRKIQKILKRLMKKNHLRSKYHNRFLQRNRPSLNRNRMKWLHRNKILNQTVSLQWQLKVQERIKKRNKRSKLRKVNLSPHQ